MTTPTKRKVGMIDRWKCLGVGLAAFCSLALFGSNAAAASTIGSPNPPIYHVEIEPKLNLAYLFWKQYGGNAWGPGVRVSIPLMSPGFISSINNSVAIGFGLDMMQFSGDYNGYYGWYGNCKNKPQNCPGWYYGYDNSFWAVELPVVMQWNFWLTEKWSVFGEPGLTIRHAFYSDVPWCDSRLGPCYPNSTNLYFTFYAGGRYNFNDRVALTMRLGHPVDFSIGLSIFL